MGSRIFLVVEERGIRKPDHSGGAWCLDAVPSGSRPRTGTSEADRSGIVTEYLLIEKRRVFVSLWMEGESISLRKQIRGSSKSHICEDSGESV